LGEFNSGLGRQLPATENRFKEDSMNHIKSLVAVFALLITVLGAAGQQTSTPPASASGSTVPARNAATVRGCLEGERGNYILIENNTSLVYVLKGVGNKLDGQLHHEVEVRGRTLAGTVKTGVRPEKAGSNPSDTVHGVDGMVLQVADVQKDVQTVSKHCKAADRE
jgi:hypothetical protein